LQIVDPLRLILCQAQAARAPATHQSIFSCCVVMMGVR
jgi:hypothetical protein